MIVIAHRGASLTAPENTLPAFEQALDVGADGIEFDVRVTADGRLVVIHDDNLERITGDSTRIADMTFDEVRRADVGRRREWGARLQVPCVEEVIELASGRARLFIELKASWRDGEFRSAAPAAEAILPLVAGVPGVTLSSFDPLAVAAVRALAPEIPTGIGCAEALPLDWCLQTAVSGGHEECHVSNGAVEVGFIRRAHDAGRRVLVWTVNEPSRLRELRDIGVDGVFTDDPAGARAACAPQVGTL
ncbi:MAG: glycerophosphodiester phosphodiesterase [Actinomycetota bacterium]